jgi:hypothetical protein
MIVMGYPSRPNLNCFFWVFSRPWQRVLNTMNLTTTLSTFIVRVTTINIFISNNLTDREDGPPTSPTTVPPYSDTKLQQIF